MIERLNLVIIPPLVSMAHAHTGSDDLLIAAAAIAILWILIVKFAPSRPL